MPAYIPKAAPRKGRASSGPGAVLSPEWLELRQQVTVAMGQRQMDMARLAEATGFAVSTIEIAMTRRSRPSRPILAALRVWLADPGEAQAAEEPPQVPGGSNGKRPVRRRHQWPSWRQHPPRPLRSRSWPLPRPRSAGPGEPTGRRWAS